MNQLIPQRRTVHTFIQTQLAFFVEYNGRLLDLWLNGRSDSAAYRFCLNRIEDLRPRIPQAQRVRAMYRFDPFEQLTLTHFFSNNGSERSLFLDCPVPNVLYQEETHAAN